MSWILLRNLKKFLSSRVRPELEFLRHGVRHGFKIGGAKTIIELESEPKLILIYKFIKLSKILIHAFKY